MFNTAAIKVIQIRAFSLVLNWIGFCVSYLAAIRNRQVIRFHLQLTFAKIDASVSISVAMCCNLLKIWLLSCMKLLPKFALGYYLAFWLIIWLLLTNWYIFGIQVINWIKGIWILHIWTTLSSISSFTFELPDVGDCLPQWVV